MELNTCGGGYFLLESEIFLVIGNYYISRARSTRTTYRLYCLSGEYIFFLYSRIIDTFYIYNNTHIPWNRYMKYRSSTEPISSIDFSVLYIHTTQYIIHNTSIKCTTRLELSIFVLTYSVYNI